MTYKREEVLASALEFFGGDKLAADVWVDKYSLSDLNGNYFERTPEDMWRRLAREFARIEANYPNPLSEEAIFGLLKDWKVVPQGSPMSGIGNPYQIQSLSNCFVIPAAEDSYGGILRNDELQVQIMKRRGGVGHDLSPIRPKRLPTTNAAKTSDGVVAFAHRYSHSCREVAQDGRRGALMMTLSVHHPDVVDFARMKLDPNAVTGANVSIRITDEFMAAVKNGEKYQQRFPVEPGLSEYKVNKWVDAREVWEAITAATRQCSEPGYLFWDTVTSQSPADIYADFGFKTESTNPCMTGDTRVAVADGRGYVPFKQLADEGVDVPVYCRDTYSGEIVIRQMQHPRLTGNQVPIYKVTIEGGHTFRTTANHKMILRDGSEKAVIDLQPGDQLCITHKAEAKFQEIYPQGKPSARSQDYYWLRQNGGWKPEHRVIWEHFHKRKIPAGYVIHHVDFHARNNSLVNLQLLSKEAHHEVHAAQMRGEKNPIFKIKADPERFAAYSAKMSASVSAGNNANALSDVSHDDICRHMLALTKSLGYRVSHKTWQAYAKEHGLPMVFTAWRQSELGTIGELSLWAAREAGLPNIEVDPRLQKTLKTAEEQGYVAWVSGNRVMVQKQCEWCSADFETEYHARELAFCSQSCSQLHGNRLGSANVKRTASIQEMHAKRAEESKRAILDVYTELRFKFGRLPRSKEVEAECHSRGLSYRLKTKNGFKSWKDLKEQAAGHNHRVVSVEPCGVEDVYNGTVDEFHNFCFAVGEEPVEGLTKYPTLWLVSRQCGEITLSRFDSCRLLLMNLMTYVRDPFTPQARFDHETFRADTEKAQRLMDDLVDLEVEAVDRIIAKVKSDPEPDDIKQVELRLWEQIREVGLTGRRTGLGITALGDAIAACGFQYGSDDSLDLTNQIYRSLAISAYTSSIHLAHERGAFPIFNGELEKGHPYLSRILAELPETVVQMYRTTGRRNIADLTTAPAGSSSIMTQTTSGIEPVIFIQQRRKRKKATLDADFRVDETDAQGDQWQVYDVFHPGVKTWMTVTGETDVSKSPYAGSTVEEIDPTRKVDIQAVAQKWIDHSISNTCNLPENVTAEAVRDLCWHAWETGCKGFTIYRIGSRNAVIKKADDTSSTQQPGSIVEHHAPKRPKELECDIHRTTVQGEKYLVIVGLLDGKPYEVLAGLQEHVEVPARIKKGRLQKNGRKDGVATYNLILPIGDSGDELVLKDVVNLFANLTHGAFTRMISLSLRHGAPVKYLVEQLQKDKNSEIMSFSRCIARVLGKHYIPDGTPATVEKACPKCGSTNLVYQQGCATCYSCGDSKCG